MKRTFIFTAVALLTFTLFQSQKIVAQSPNKMSYQAVIRNSSDELVNNQEIGMQISILKDSPDGSVVYSETQTTTSNSNGLVSLEIGDGETSHDLAAVNWNNGIYYIKTESDPNGGTNYTLTTTNQLLSVPYALHANTATRVIETSDQLGIIWTSGDREVALKMVFMYTKNSKIYGWWDNITLVVWGPSAKLLSEDEELQDYIKEIIAQGTTVKACKSCADMYGVSETLEELGIEVKYMGEITDYLKDGWHMMTF